MSREKKLGNAKSIYSLLGAMFMLLPRSPAAYLFYTLTPFVMALSVRNIRSIFVCSVFFIFCFVVGLFSFNLSLTAFLVEYVLLIPFLIGVLGGVLNSRYLNVRVFIEVLSYFTFLLSIFALVAKGFPFKLPYVHYAPDYYYALFYIGGAKIVTVIGFLGLFSAFFFTDVGEERRKIHIAVAALNLLAPNFIIGILSALVAFAFAARQNIFLMVGMLFVILVGYDYVSFRMANINDGFTILYGHHPKIYQFVALLNLFRDSPVTVLFGAGLGQFASEAALWASPAFSSISSFSSINLPGFFSADPHLRHVAPTLQAFVYDPWVISSSGNKPYGGFMSLIGETGLVFPIVVLTLYAHRLRRMDTRGTPSIVALTFVFTILVFDIQQDSPWFGLMIICINTLFWERTQQTAASEMDLPTSLAPARPIT